MNLETAATPWFEFGSFSRTHREEEGWLFVGLFFDQFFLVLLRSQAAAMASMTPTICDKQTTTTGINKFAGLE